MYVLTRLTYAARGSYVQELVAPLSRTDELGWSSGS